MGVVLRAFDDKLHRVVAIKALAPALASSGPARQRFVREARATAAVNHDNVIDIHAVEDDGRVPYLVMQFTDGPTLQEKIDRSGPLPLKEVLRIGMQVASGLAAAHAHGLVHRDVKPANILLENGVERVRITDFGLARAVDDASLTQSGIIAGTPTYMSPEQAKGERVDHRSDLFSLGSVLYTLCAGHPPFRAETTMAVLRRICDDTPRPVREVNPDVPDWLEVIIGRLHAKEPAGRFQSATELADLLGRYLAHLQQPGVVAPMVRYEGGACKPRVPRARGGRVAAVLLLTVALLGGGSVALYRALGQRDKEKDPGASNGRAVRCFKLGKATCRKFNSDGRQTMPYFAYLETSNGPASNGTAQEELPWRPRPPLTAQELAKLPSPLDALKREAMGVPEGAPAELVAVLGGFPRFALPERMGTHWMAQSNDGRLLAVPCGLNILLFDTRTGTLVRTLTGHTHQPYRPVFSPDGKRLAAADDAQVIVWNADSYEELHTLPTPGKGLLAFTPDGRTLLTARLDCNKGERHAFTRWDVKTGTEQKTCELRTRGNYVFFHLSPDGRTVFVSQDRPAEARVRAYDAQTGQKRFPLTGHAGAVQSMAVSPDGRTLATGSGRTIRLWDLAGWRCGEPSPPFRTLSGDHTNDVWSLAFSPDGKLLASGGIDGRLLLWEPASGRKVDDLIGHSPAYSYLTFSPDGRTIAAGGKDGTINRWDVVTGQPKEPWRWHGPDASNRSEVRPVAYSPDGRLLASGGRDARAQLLDAVTGQRRRTFQCSTFVTNLAFSPDGRSLASVDAAPSATLRLWELETKAERALIGHTDHILGLAFHPGGGLVATASWDYSVRLWDVTPPGKEERLIDFRGIGKPYCLAFTPEGRHLVVGLDNGLIAILRVPARSPE